MLGPNKQIIALRHKLKLSQEDFAKEIGYSQSYVKDIEINRVKPSRQFLEAINSRFGISVDKILVGLGNKVENTRSYIHGHGFIYLFDFVEENLKTALEEVVQAFQNNPLPLVVADAKNKTMNQILSILKDEKERVRKLWDESGFTRKYNVRGYILFILKNISLSKVNKKAYFLLDFYHKTGKSGDIIIIDRASFLEANYNILAKYMYPIYIGNYTEDFILLDRGLIRSI